MPERIHTVTDYYDGIRAGVADYAGRAHYYESQWEDINSPKRNDTFRLTPISDETLQLAIEDWEIWRRWEYAFHAGQTTQDTHPALPEDRRRHEELKLILAERLQIDEENCVVAEAAFEIDTFRPRERGIRNFVVEWRPTKNNGITSRG